MHKVIAIMFEIVLSKDAPVEYSQDFLNFVRAEIPDIMVRTCQIPKLALLETFLNANYSKPLSGKPYNAYELCIIAMYNLITKQESENYIIKINPNAIYPGTYLKLVDLCKLINFGNLGIKGYPIFTEIFRKVENNIVNLYEKYEGLNDGFLIR